MITSETIRESYITAINKKIDNFLKDELVYWTDIDISISAPLNALHTFILSGGKRLRPSFCLLGYMTAGGSTIDEEFIDLGCSLEMLHNFALVHDDFMDRADTRRSLPTVHKQLFEYYAQENYTGDLEHFANSVAILTGDFAFTYAERFARHIPEQCRDVFDLLKVELFAGQQMDLDAVYRKGITKEKVALIAQYKSGRYTIERPLQLGALFANDAANPQLWEGFGRPLGEAFQLRDDILGTFGDHTQTGKPVGDDIREGKFTILIAEALDRANDKQKVILELRGNNDLSDGQIFDIVEMVRETGALEAAEARIQELYDSAFAVLKKLELPQDVFEVADELAHHVCWRES